MENAVKVTKAESYVISSLERLPILSYYTTSRGWSFLISWGHRLAGLTLVGYMFAHIYTLSLLFHPATFDADMRFLNNFFFTFLEWCVAIPLIYHSLNGGRLILYELYTVRREDIVLRTMTVLGVVYLIIVGFFFIQEGPQPSLALLWPATFVLSLVVFGAVLLRISKTRNTLLWKLQRITGAFMIPMVIGHMFFMHMNYLTGHDSKTILMRVQSPVIKGIDFAFIVLLVFHAGYGIFSIMTDYLKPGFVLKSLTALVFIVMAISAYFGIRLVIAL